MGRLQDKVAIITGAVTIMTKKDAATYGRENIRGNSIHPGTVVTRQAPNVHKAVKWQGAWYGMRGVDVPDIETRAT